MAPDEKQSIKIEDDEKSSNLQKLLQYGCLEMVRVPQKCTEKRNNFTIDYILGTNEKSDQNLNTIEPHYDWLHYTRYRPPKLQRIRKKECIQKRRLGRNPRIPFSSEQVAILEEKFQTSPYLSNSDVNDLSTCLQLSESRIKIWFQNRRARERRDGNDTSEKGLNLIKSFLMKTRHPSSINTTYDVQDLSMSAFKPCHNLAK
ncbi:homeobox protein vab-15 [Planococcus citri]|uniref:homeobox protein vab-15 n=1 Tax=Planococcus citri TaxID=170843 RepID=UPI0031F9AC70